MKWKIRGNFKTLSNLINLDNGNITKLNVFVRNNKELLSYRMKHGNIREIHGDLYLRNIFLSNGKSYFMIELNSMLR
jgi:aminoglycoside phosphotransferase family enzyme